MQFTLDVFICYAPYGNAGRRTDDSITTRHAQSPGAPCNDALDVGSVKSEV